MIDLDDLHRGSQPHTRKCKNSLECQGFATVLQTLKIGILILLDKRREPESRMLPRTAGHGSWCSDIGRGISVIPGLEGSRARLTRDLEGET